MSLIANQPEASAPDANLLKRRYERRDLEFEVQQLEDRIEVLEQTKEALEESNAVLQKEMVELKEAQSANEDTFTRLIELREKELKNSADERAESAAALKNVLQCLERSKGRNAALDLNRNVERIQYNDENARMQRAMGVLDFYLGLLERNGIDPVVYLD